MSELTDLERHLIDALRTRAASASPPAHAWQRIVVELAGNIDRIGGRADVAIDILPETEPEFPAEIERWRRWPIAVIGAAAALLLVIVLLLASREDPDAENIFTEDREQPDDDGDHADDHSLESDPVAARGLIGPGSWSVAAVATDATFGQLGEVVEEVRRWPGVLEAEVVADETTWRRLTGRDRASCRGEDTQTPCGPGIVLLVVGGQSEVVARRLESELSMTTTTSHEHPWDFFDGYVAAAIESASPAPLRFDPTPLGREILMTGPAVGAAASEGCPVATCDVAVDVDIQGRPVRVSLAALSPDRVETEPEFDRPQLILGLGDAIAIHSVGDLLPGRDGAAGVSGNFGIPIEGRRAAFAVFGLPLEIAVVTVELPDGTTVWQRPLAGMALLFDGADSFSPDTETETTMEALDADGNTVLIIEGGSGVPELTVTDLRIGSEGRRTPGFDPTPPTPVVVDETGLKVTWTEAGGGASTVPKLGHLVATPAGIIGSTNAGSGLRWTKAGDWEEIDALAGVDIDSVVDGGEFVLVSGTRRSDGDAVLMQSSDGVSWLVIDRSPIDGLVTGISATSPSGLTLATTGQAFSIDGDRVRDLHNVPWGAECCFLIDLLDFDGVTTALIRDFNEPRVSAAWRYLGAGRWAPPVPVPISSNVAMVDGTALMFDHTDLRCCRPPVGAQTQSTLLTSTNGTEWTPHATLDDTTTSGLQVEAGDSFWAYGLHGYGGNNIERYGEFATLWISTDALSWVPVDISFTPEHSIVSVVGDTIFVSDAGTGRQQWIGHVESD